jgi:hypothetical protein
MSFWIGLAAIASGVLLAFVLIALHAANEVRVGAAKGGRQVLRLRAKLLRWPFASGLTPLAVVYRVTTQPAEPEAKAVVKLYAYDPGQVFLRGSNVRQLSGGVWRDA